MHKWLLNFGQLSHFLTTQSVQDNKFSKINRTAFNKIRNVNLICRQKLAETFTKWFVIFEYHSLVIKTNLLIKWKCNFKVNCRQLIRFYK